MRHLVIGVLQGLAQALQLQSADLVAAGGLDRVKFAGGGLALGHRGSPELLRDVDWPERADQPSTTTGLPRMVYERPRNTATRSPRWLSTSVS